MDNANLFEEIYFKELELEQEFSENKLNEILNIYQKIQKNYETSQEIEKASILKEKVTKLIQKYNIITVQKQITPDSVIPISHSEQNKIQKLIQNELEIQTMNIIQRWQNKLEQKKAKALLADELKQKPQNIFQKSQKLNQQASLTVIEDEQNVIYKFDQAENLPEKQEKPFFNQQLLYISTEQILTDIPIKQQEKFRQTIEKERKTNLKELQKVMKLLKNDFSKQKKAFLKKPKSDLNNEAYKGLEMQEKDLEKFLEQKYISQFNEKIAQLKNKL